MIIAESSRVNTSIHGFPAFELGSRVDAIVAWGYDRGGPSKTTSRTGWSKVIVSVIDSPAWTNLLAYQRRGHRTGPLPLEDVEDLQLGLGRMA